MAKQQAWNKLTLKDAQQWAIEHDGRCLSETYEKASKVLTWKCKEGHIFERTFMCVRANPNLFCTVCDGPKEYTIEDMKAFAASLGGECLSTEYKNSTTKLKWKCARDHIWEAVRPRGKKPPWCRKCADEKAGDYHKLALDDAQRAAEEKGGKCLSTEYINARTPMLWECFRGHQWKTCLDHIKNQGTWCPTCNNSKSEELCRNIFEQAFNSEFKSFYPIWLKNKAGNQLELDGCNAELQIAFEYNGEQHYLSPDKTWYQDKDRLASVQEDDQIKVELCKKFGVKLIVIPYWEKEKGLDHLKNFIATKLNQFEIEVPDHFFKIIPDQKKIYSKDPLEEFRIIAEKRGGRIISETYVNSHTHLTIECKRKHIKQQMPLNIKKGRWCRDCTFIEKREERLKNKANKVAISK